MSPPKAAPEKGTSAWNPPGHLSLADRASHNTSSSPAPSPALGCEGPGQAQMLGAPRHSHPGSSLGCGLGPCPPFPGPLAGLQLRAERSRLGSSSSMALLPHYPDVGPSPPRLYRLSAGSARVMRALLITIAETPLTLTAPREERQHLLCTGRRPAPAPHSPSLAAPLFPGPLPQPTFPSSPGSPLQPSLSNHFSFFYALSTTPPAGPFSTSPVPG